MLPALLTEIDAATELRLATWRPAQKMFCAEHGRYMQVLSSHTVIPADGAYVAPDRLAESPDYQGVSLADLGFSSEPVTCAFSVDQFANKEDRGWALNLFVLIAGELWCRTIGHDTASSYPWQIVMVI